MQNISEYGRTGKYKELRNEIVLFAINNSLTIKEVLVVTITTLGEIAVLNLYLHCNEKGLFSKRDLIMSLFEIPMGLRFINVIYGHVKVLPLTNDDLFEIECKFAPFINISSTSIPQQDPREEEKLLFIEKYRKDKSIN